MLTIRENADSCRVKNGDLTDRLSFSSETGQTNRLKPTYTVKHSTNISEPTLHSAVVRKRQLTTRSVARPVSETLAQCFSSMVETPLREELRGPITGRRIVAAS